MKRFSLRWWLPLSYGAVAFITAVSLGVVLLLALQSYYAWQERRYLHNNMEAISGVVQQILESGAHDLLPSQIDTFAYLTQTQINVFAADGRLLAGSQNPRDLQAVATLSLQIDTGQGRQALSQTVDSTEERSLYTSLLVLEGENGRLTSQSSVSGDVGSLGTVAGFAAPLLRLETANSTGLIGAGNTGRSHRVLRQPLPPGVDGQSPGTVVLSQGPALGRAVLTSVAWGTAVAGGVAVLVATAAGWLMSRRLSRPIVQLAAAARQMAGGDLTVRSTVARPDELHQLGSAFNEMAARIALTIATLRQFVADAAHELNTPLTALRTNLELAAQTSPADSYLAAAQIQTLRLQHLNDNLLRLSRLESPLAVEAWQMVDLAALAAGLSERFAAQAEQAGLLFRVDLPSGPVFCRGSQENLRQAMENLLENGLKFTPSGGEISFSLAVSDSWASVRVRDTGIGVPAAELGLIFGRFYRGQNAGGYPGSGLGLAIVQRIAETHGGGVTAVNRNPGTEFILRLPL